MIKLKKFFELLAMLIMLPFNISKGQKKKAYKKIKQQMVSVNLL